jgi:signal transduction histidine kinase
MNYNKSILTKITDFSVIVEGIILALVYWISEAIIMSLYFSDRNFFNEFFYPKTHELWMRSVGFSIIILFSIYLQFVINKRKKAERKAVEEHKKAELYLDILGHDISNMNQAILFNNYLLSNSEDQKKAKKYVENIQDHANSISELIDKIRLISNLNEHEFTIEKLDVQKIISNSIKNVKKIHPKKDIKINHSIPGSKLIIKGNKIFSEVIDNILGNAIKYNKNGEIKIDIDYASSEDNKFWMIEFKDNGPGIHDNLKKNIFKRFSRGDDSIHGNGLGLTIVHEIITRAGGKVWVEDHVIGQSIMGSNFIIMLPKFEAN